MNDESGAVLITGASRGLGEALAMEFARLGRPVALCARGADAVADTADRLRHQGVPCVAEAVDVTDAAAVEGWVARAEAELGPRACW